MEALSGMMISLLLVAAILDWPVAFILVKTAWHTSIRALRERALVAVGITILSNGFLLVILNNEMKNIFWSDDTSKVIARLLVCVIGLIPQMYWLFLYVTGGFSDK